MRTDYEGPTGCADRRCRSSSVEAGIPTVGLWAQVPHYVAGQPVAARGPRALLERLRELGGLRVDLTDLDEQVDVYAEKVDEGVAERPDVAGARAGDRGPDAPRTSPATRSPREIERFLRVAARPGLSAESPGRQPASRSPRRRRARQAGAGSARPVPPGYVPSMRTRTALVTRRGSASGGSAEHRHGLETLASAVRRDSPDRRPEEHPMSVVRINAITVPTERAEELERRFAARAGEVSKSPGFEAFELLRPDRRPRHVPRVHAVALAGGLRRVGEQPRVRARPQGPQHRGPGEQPQRAVVVRRRAARGRRGLTHAGSRASVTLAARLPRRSGATSRSSRTASSGWPRSSRGGCRESRGRWLWIATIVAEAAMMLQVLVGVILVASKDYTAPRFHMFYGFLAFLTVGLAYQYRSQMRGRRELLYGLVGLFIMGLGIRAVLQVS